MQRLGLDLAKVDAGDVGLLARLERADQILQPHRLGPAPGRRAQRLGGGERGGILGHGLGKDRGGARLADHVEVVVAGRAVGADGERHARLHQRAGRAESGGQLEVGFRAVHHAHAALGAEVDLGLGELRHVHRDQAVVEQAQAIQPRDRAHPVLVHGLLHFLRGFVQVQMNRDVELVREQAHAGEVVIVHRVGRMRRERGLDERVIAPLVVHFAGTVEVFVIARCPRGRKIDHRQADARAESELLVGRRLHVGEEVVLVGAGGAAPQHLGNRQRAAIGDEIRPDHRGLDRPDVLLQPDLQRQVVGDPAQQGHRIVGVGIDQAGDQRPAGPRHDGLRIEACARFRDGQDREDRPPGNGDGVIREDHAVRHHRHDPAGFDEDVAGFPGGVGHRLTSLARRIRRCGCRP